MADTKTSALTAKTSVDPADLLYGVDVSDTTMAPSGTSKKLTRELLQTYNAGTLTTDKKVLDLSATWNAAGVTFTGIKANVTDTASASGSLLMDLQVNGGSRFSYSKTGTLTLYSADGANRSPTIFAASFANVSGATGAGVFFGSAVGSIAIQAQGGGTGTISINTGAAYSWSNDLGIWRDAADTLAQRRSTNVQAFRLYRTFTDTSNLAYTAAKQDATTGYILDSVNAGTGTEPTNLLDCQLNGSSKFKVSKTGYLSAFSGFVTATGVNEVSVNYYQSGVGVTSSGTFTWGSGSTAGSPDLILARDAANTLAQRNSTNAQTFRIYNSYTDGSNWERGKFEWSSNVLRIGTEKAGTGTARALELQTDGTTRVTISTSGTVNVSSNASIDASGNLTLQGFASVTGICYYRSDIQIRNKANDGWINFATRNTTGTEVVYDLSNVGTVKFAGTTSSFPALKRSSATLQVRLADDSAFAAIEALNLTNGRTIQRFTPLDNQPPASNFATLDTRNSVAVLDFDAATDESAIFVGYISQAATLTSGIKVIISWSATSATSGDCVWGAQFEKTTGQDIDSDGFDTATTATTTTSGTSGVVNTTTITCTTIDSLAAGDCFRVKIYRDADAGGDTMTGDAELVAVELQQVA